MRIEAENRVPSFFDQLENSWSIEWVADKKTSNDQLINENLFAS